MYKRGGTLLSIVLLFSTFCGPLRAEVGHIKEFVRGSYQTIVTSRSNTPFVVSLWSIDCPPCRKELVLWREFHQQHPDLNVVLISTDEPDLRPEVEDVLTELGLQQLESWHFGDPFVERLRYEIDKNWFGELPRTYFYSLTGEVKAISGVVDEAEISTWIAQNLSQELIQ